MPKVNKLQRPKLRLAQSLLVATFTQNFMRFRCTIMEKRHPNFPPHSSVCDDLYRACTFAWDNLNRKIIILVHGSSFRSQIFWINVHLIKSIELDICCAGMWLV